jgi:signal transduction histidine kinase
MALESNYLSSLQDQLFPFHFVVDPELRIIGLGKSASKLFSGIVHQHFAQVFELARPKIDFTFKSITDNLDTLYVFKTIHQSEIQIKGQIILLADGNLLLVFTPIVRDVAFLKKFNITMHDFPYYDTTLELLFSLQASQRALHEAKRISNEFESKVAERTSQLKKANESLKVQNEEYLIQQMQLNKQSLFLEKKNKKLQKARELIHAKNIELKKYSSTLAEQVSQRTLELTRVNNHLIQRNSQLEQFAFTVAHNLRAPIARVLGLLNVMKLESLVTSENRFYIDNVHTEINRLDEVVRDLSHMLEITTDSDRPLEVLYLPQTIHKILESLSSEVEKSSPVFEFKMEIENIQTVPLYMESILKNLLSNSLKFRSEERLKVFMETKLQNGFFHLWVTDNGIGFDVEENRQNLFKPYKQFHSHLPGKGLGLFLVKTQVELLKGTIEVDSKVNSGTTVSIRLPTSF